MIADELKQLLAGEVLTDDETLTYYSRDASLFEVRPSCVIYPKHVDDIQKLVRLVAEKKARGENVSITPRAAGTDMTGGPLSESIVMDVTKHMNHIREIGTRLHSSGAEEEGFIVTEPGVFYRDFEKETLAKGFILPSYPASRELCAIGGMVSNNAGGEKTLRYGKTQDYVLELKVVLADGNEYIIKPLTVEELAAKRELKTFEGELYSKLYDVLEKNFDLAKKAKPNVSKNSAGYNIWDIWDRKTFDLTKLFVGSQGTLGIVTRVKFRLVRKLKHAGMAVVFMKDLSPLADIVGATLPFEPSSFESFDDHTFKLALKFFWGFLKLFARNPFSLFFAFLPDLFLALTSGVPKLVLLIEFEENSQAAVDEKLASLFHAFQKFDVMIKIARTKTTAKKYWVIRRESFNLLRQRVKNLHTAPFVDDLIVPPKRLPEYLPKLYQILDKYHLLYTIAGHVGNGNFHIIPLMDLTNELDRSIIKPAMDEIMELTLSFGGSLTAEHNDGIIRTPYLPRMFGGDVYALFVEIKRICDPNNIFNPGKKVNGSFAYAQAHIKRS